MTDLATLIQEDAQRRVAERDRRLARPCDRPRCGAQSGQPCLTPNGYITHHKSREGEPNLAKPRRHRLSDAQAQRIENAAHHGRIYAAGQYATLSGDAAERACADALLNAGLMRVTGIVGDGERELVLTPEGWRTYWHHRLIIRDLPGDRHNTTCPCTTTHQETAP